VLRYRKRWTIWYNTAKHTQSMILSVQEPNHLIHGSLKIRPSGS